MIRRRCRVTTTFAAPAARLATVQQSFARLFAVFRFTRCRHLRSACGLRPLRGRPRDEKENATLRARNSMNSNERSSIIFWILTRVMDVLQWFFTVFIRYSGIMFKRDRNTSVEYVDFSKRTNDHNGKKFMTTWTHRYDN